MDEGKIIEGLGSNASERMPLSNQAQAVALFLTAAEDAMESAKIAAEMMDAEQALKHVGAIRPAAKQLMAARFGVKQALAAWQSLAEQLPRIVTLGEPREEDRKGPLLEAPPKRCTACGGSRRTWDSAQQAKVRCERCKGSGVEP